LNREKPSSCTLCRSRKIKCDRGTPCSNCLKSRKGTCVYGDYRSHSPQQQLARPQRPPTPQYSTPVSSISRATTVPSHLSSGLSTSPTSGQTPTSDPFLPDIKSLQSKIIQLEQQLAEATHKSAQSRAKPLVPNTEESISYRGETWTIYKTRMLGQSHWMNGCKLVDYYGIHPTLSA
jgi:hypothetical protein